MPAQPATAERDHGIAVCVADAALRPVPRACLSEPLPSTLGFDGPRFNRRFLTFTDGPLTVLSLAGVAWPRRLVPPPKPLRSLLNGPHDRKEGNRFWHRQRSQPGVVHHAAAAERGRRYWLQPFAKRKDGAPRPQAGRTARGQ